MMRKNSMMKTGAAVLLAFMMLCLAVCGDDKTADNISPVTGDDNNNWSQGEDKGGGQSISDDDANNYYAWDGGFAAYLAAITGDTEAAPVTVTLPATRNLEKYWDTVTSLVWTAGKYVILDLSVCSSGFIDGKPIQNNQYIKGIILPSDLTAIGDGGWFNGCTNLTSITIPNGVTIIGELAFAGCTGLTSITIPNGVTKIESGAFAGCTGLTSITIPNGVTIIGNNAFAGCTGLTSITIPNGVTSIGNNAFGRCTGLTSITIPHRVTSIGEGAFWHCTSLANVTIPGSVTSISVFAFRSCSSLISVTFGQGSNITYFGDWAFDDNDLKTKYYARSRPFATAVTFTLSQNGYSWD
jgi:hypothetical protein